MTILANSDDLVGATTHRWQNQLKSAIRSAEELASYVEIPFDSISQTQADGGFPLFAPRPFLDRIRKGDLNDPLLRQIMPVNDESFSPTNFVKDPLGESQFHQDSGLLRKYSGRALLLVNGRCAVHCRYCFRRHFPYSETVDSKDKWSSALSLIQADVSIREVILSGGDPLTIVDEQLGLLIERLDAIKHVKRVRIHSRLPVVIPDRVTDRLLSILESSRLAAVLVIHCNHANELDQHVASACKRMNEVCTGVLNQAVLMRSINDSVDSLVRLSERLFELNVIPYYLHQLDPVQGASHFHVPIERGTELILAIRNQLPGFLVPRYVQEIPGEASKTIIA